MARMASAHVVDEQVVLPVQHDAFHLALAGIVVGCYCAIGTKDVRFFPLAEG